ncbi:LPS export ABC transporter periplasmic protein LptC [Ponticaulis profundi]|uniref:LPS export ABC transporter periplasmic protein LptC n=1 Tax=Ponticaulis profundi TaxID=2665222 RepID=A0ABW1SBY6_9PROT
MSAIAATQEDFWAPKRRLSLEQARKRSDLVRFLRMLFTTIAAISAGVMIGSLAYSVISGETASTIDAGDNMVTMQNPRFSGRDATGQPYVITASSAKRNGANPAIVELVSPSLDESITGTVSAPRGEFDQATQQLELFDDVIMTDSSGMRFSTTHARLFVQENRVVGVQPLTGEGPIGKIRADSYEILDGGDRVIFKGNVWTELEPSEPDTGE